MPHSVSPVVSCCPLLAAVPILRSLCVSTPTNPSDAPASASAPDAMIHPLSLVKRFWLLLVVAIVVVLGALHWFRNAFHDQGYAPEQPIAFSHAIHAGQLKMDCQYCHSNASRGKHAGIPAMSVCLGCHKQVATDKPEIQKLTAIADSGSYTDENGVVREGGVVHWNRVHRLPDHVYFSHEWHVKAGVACQTCHGPIEEMTKVRQFSDLTMAWCLDCHRKTNYVGGPAFDATKPATFVGTGDYSAARANQDRDPVVVWHERQLKGRDAAAHDQPAAQSGHGHIPETVAEIETHAEKLAKLIERHPEWQGLPRWKIADLPESHRAIYGDERFMNAPTQCSTCHQ
jgi:cytochrome c553